MGTLAGMDEPRWLTDAEQRTWRGLLAATQMLFDRIESDLQRTSDLSHADYEILVRLSEAPDQALRMSDLAEQATFSRSRLSHAISRLEKDGVVERRPCPSDRRGLLAVLTDKGFARLVEAAPGHVESVRRALLDPLTAEQISELGEIACTLQRHLDALASPASGSPCAGTGADPTTDVA
jgi:DNA-binding MarR family transcriptional regulator